MKQKYTTGYHVKVKKMVKRMSIFFQKGYVIKGVFLEKVITLRNIEARNQHKSSSIFKEQ